MRVKMLTDAPGSPDGVTVNEYSQDDVYNVADQLGAVFVDHGLAVEVDPVDLAVGAKPEPEPVGADTSNLTKKKDSAKQASGPAENK